MNIADESDVIDSVDVRGSRSGDVFEGIAFAPGGGVNRICAAASGLTTVPKNRVSRTPASARREATILRTVRM
jgi:hypothetical protein